MKTLIILFLSSFHFFLAHAQSEKIDSVKSMILGEWVWVQSMGGIFGSEIITPENSGIKKSFEFFDKDTLLVIENEDTTLLEPYTIIYGKSIMSGDSVYLLKIEGLLEYRILMFGEELHLEENVYDGYGHTFHRKPDPSVIQAQRIDSVKTKLLGEWIWYRSMGAGIQTPESSGITKRYEFKKNDTLVIVENGDITFSEPYKIKYAESALSGTMDYMVNFNDIDYKILMFDKDTLNLGEDVFDGFSHDFYRKPDPALVYTQKLDSIKNELLGKWFWHESVGGFSSGDIVTPGNSGIQKTYEFFENDSLCIIENGDTTLNKEYTINYGEFVILKDSGFLLEIKDFMAYRIQMRGEALFLEENVYDGYGHVLKREEPSLYSNIAKIDSLKSLLLGEWVWYKSAGGSTGDDEVTPDNSGLEKSYEFTQNDTVIIIESGDTIKLTSFQVKYQKQQWDSDAQFTLTIKQNDYRILKLTEDTLIMEELVQDGYKHYFQNKAVIQITSVLRKVNKAKVYPNPCRNYIYINNSSMDYSQLSIYSLNGKLLLKKDYDKDIVNISNFKPGVYLLVLSNEKEVHTFKIQKE